MAGHSTKPEAKIKAKRSDRKEGGEDKDNGEGAGDEGLDERTHLRSRTERRGIEISATRRRQEETAESNTHNKRTHAQKHRAQAGQARETRSRAQQPRRRQGRRHDWAGQAHAKRGGKSAQDRHSLRQNGCGIMRARVGKKRRRAAHRKGHRVEDEAEVGKDRSGSHFCHNTEVHLAQHGRRDVGRARRHLRPRNQTRDAKGRPGPTHPESQMIESMSMYI